MGTMDIPALFSAFFSGFLFGAVITLVVIAILSFLEARKHP